MKTDPTLTHELLAVIQNIREHLIGLEEMGIDDIESSQPGPAFVSAQPPHSEDSALPSHGGQSMGTEAARKAASPVSSSLFGNLIPSEERLCRSEESIEQIWAELANCQRCPLHTERKNVVHTEGNRKARLMFVGEAPGADEDEQARPFVGRAGQLLTKIIEAIGFTREEVLIGNINRCRPPGNRPPTPDEVAMCKPFLLREIAVVQPKVIVVLGNTAMKNLLDTKEGITKLRGRFHDYKGIKVMPTFHPAYLLRDPSKKRETWSDLKKVRDYLDAVSEKH